MTKKTKLILMILAIVLVIGAVAAVAIGMNQGENPPQVQATDPTGDPTGGNDPTEGGDPTDPSQGNEPTDPTGGNDPTEPTQGSDVTTPTEGNDPTEGTDPTDPAAPTDPTDPTGGNDPTDPTTAPTEAPTDPTQPTEPTEPVHTHSYTSKVTKEADCGEKGIRTYTCACGDSYTKSISALKHDYSATVVEPTYDAKGYTRYDCSKCGHYYKDSYTDKLVRPVEADHVHNYVAQVTEPNCFLEGYTIYHCSCGRSYKDLNSTTKAVGHTWSEWTSDGKGNVTKECVICGSKRMMPEGANEADYEIYYNDSTAPGYSMGIDSNTNKYVGDPDVQAGVSWDGKSPIIYTYPDGTTGTEPKLGATYFVNKCRIATVNAYTLGLITQEEFTGNSGVDDCYCPHCGKTTGDGTNGTCKYRLTDADALCAYCGDVIPGRTCHTCSED